MLVNTLYDCPYGGIIYRELAKCGYKFIDNEAFGGRESSVSLREAIEESTDKILLYWRWPESCTDLRKTMAYDRQQTLLKYAERDLLILFDGDHMLPDSVEPDLPRWVPELRPGGVMFPYFEHLDVPYGKHKPGRSLLYIGTPLQREEAMRSYCRDVPVSLYGNWTHVDLPSNFLCFGKLANNRVLTKMAGRTTIILAKPSYYEKGYFTPRWYEAANACCSAILPAEYEPWLPKYLHKYIARSSADVKRLYNMLSNDFYEHNNNVRMLRAFAREINGLETWLDYA